MTRRLLAALLFLAVAVRVVLLRAPDIFFDEATNGLMALAVLRGELPLYFYGQPFMGALDAYLAAPILFLRGPTVHALKLLPLALSLTWLALTVRLAWEAFGPRAAVFAAALLALPPNFLLQWVIEARTKYHVCVVLGTLAILLAFRPAARPPGRDVLRLGALGLVLGLAFWTNFLSVVFFPPVAILLLREGIRHRIAGVVTAAGTFVLGSLPHWLYGLGHGTAIPHSGSWGGWAAVGSRVRAVGSIAWPILAGVPDRMREETAGAALAAVLALVAGLTGIVAVRAAWRAGGVHRAAALALAAVVAGNILTVVGTSHGNRIDDDPKYFLPVYTALPPLLGAGLAAMSSAAGVSLLALTLVVQSAGAAAGVLRLQQSDEVARRAALRQSYREAIAAFERDGRRRFYAENPEPSILMFLSHESIIFSDPYQEGYPPYARSVDGAPRTGWWFGGRSDIFEANLAAIGIQAVFRPIGPRGGAYVDFRLPPERLRELDPRTLQVTAYPNPEAAASMLDRDSTTVWSTGRPKKGGEWIEVDLGRVEPVALIRWLPDVFQEIPSGLHLDASVDGARWQRVVDLPEYAGPLYWSAGRPMLRVRSGRGELRIKPTPARYLRLTQTGQEVRWGWTVRELFVYASDPSATPAITDGDVAPLARAVRTAGITRLYADHGWSYQLSLREPALWVPPANLGLDAYNFTGPTSELLPAMSWEPGSGALVEPPDAPGFLRTVEASGLAATRADLGGLSLLTYAAPPGPPGRPIPPKELRVTASVNGRRAPGAADGRRETRWTTGRAQAPGDWLRIDLASVRRVRAIRLQADAPDEWPRALRLERSADGGTWTPVPAEMRTENLIRWGGITALRDAVLAVRLDMAPVTAQALRLTLDRGDPDHAWSVQELTLLVDD